MEFERNVSVDTEREIVIDDAEWKQILPIRRVCGFGVGIDLEIPTIQQHRVWVSDVRENFRDGFVGVALRRVIREQMSV